MGQPGKSEAGFEKAARKVVARDGFNLHTKRAYDRRRSNRQGDLAAGVYGDAAKTRARGTSATAARIAMVLALGDLTRIFRRWLEFTPRFWDNFRLGTPVIRIEKARSRQRTSFSGKMNSSFSEAPLPWRMEASGVQGAITTLFRTTPGRVFIYLQNATGSTPDNRGAADDG